MASSRIGIAQTLGTRDYQEDRFVASHNAALGFQTLSSTKREKVLEKTFEKLQTNHGQEEWIGSTGSAAITWMINHTLYVDIVSLGDSPIFLALIDESNRITEISQLNELHSPEEKISPSEYKRVCKYNDTHRKGYPRTTHSEVEPDYIGFANEHGEYKKRGMTRAFGDLAFERAGLSHQPSVSLVIRKNVHKAILVIASDGLIENDSSPISIGITLQQSLNKQASAREISHELVNRDKVDDNCTAITFFIKNNQPPLTGAVFDGHNGARVAEALKRNFLFYLANTIETYLTNKKTTAQILTQLPPQPSLKPQLEPIIEIKEENEDDNKPKPKPQLNNFTGNNTCHNPNPSPPSKGCIIC